MSVVAFQMEANGSNRNGGGGGNSTAASQVAAAAAERRVESKLDKMRKLQRAGYAAVLGALIVTLIIQVRIFLCAFS